MWVTICFDTGGDFAKPSYFVEYEGFLIEIKRGASTEGHNLYIETTKNKDNYGKTIEIGFRFLSELAWLFNDRVEVLTYGGSSNCRIPVQTWNRKFNRILNTIHLEDYEQVAFNNEQKLALGIYREGISSNSKFYEFLSYFKIINMKNHTSSAQENWINNNIHKLHSSKKLLDELKKEGITNFGEHLYASGRCAIAHASLKSGDPIADADSYEDNNRISRELPLIKDLAEIFIQEELKVPDRFEAFRITLLKKFRELFGENLIEEVITQDNINTKNFPKMPKISFRIYKESREFFSLEGLNFEVILADKGIILLSNESQDWPLHTEFTIDFPMREVKFDVMNVKINKDHPKFDIFLLDFYYFLKAYFPNGRLEIWNDEKQELMARLLPFIPVNICPRDAVEGFQKIIDDLESKLNLKNLV